MFWHILLDILASSFYSLLSSRTFMLMSSSKITSTYLVRGLLNSFIQIYTLKIHQYTQLSTDLSPALYSSASRDNSKVTFQRDPICRQKVQTPFSRRDSIYSRVTMTYCCSKSMEIDRQKEGREESGKSTISSDLEKSQYQNTISDQDATHISRS